MWTAILMGGKYFLGRYGKWILLAGVLLVVYFKATSFYEDYKQAKEDQARELVRTALEKQAAELSLQSLQGTLLMMMEQQRKYELLLVDSLRKQDEIRAEADKQVEVFEDHDFEGLVEAKPGLIEKLANRATAERMQEIQDALND